MARQTYRYISLFSGSMGLDLGLERAGLRPAVCVEFDPQCCQTIRLNRTKIPVLERDITQTTTADILGAAGLKRGEAFAVVGGPPCQSFSTGGLRQSIRDKRGSLFGDFLRIITESQPQYFVFENVAQIVSAAIKHRPISERPGKRWHLSSYANDNSGDGEFEPLCDDEQAGSALRLILEGFSQLGYRYTLGVLNAADYGVPQRRYRFILIGTRLSGPISLPLPTHSSNPSDGLPPWQTLRDALLGLDDPTPLHSNYTSEFQRYFEQVPPGGNWRHLPVRLQKAALGPKAYVAGGGKTGFFRRLAWDEPTPTMVGKPNRKSGAICHPDNIRPLTVREMSRVQGFPDDWRFTGAMHAQYLQIGNAVPLGLGEAIGRALKQAYKQSGRKGGDNGESHESLDGLIVAARAVLQRAARNKRSVLRDRAQPKLFPLA